MLYGVDSKATDNQKKQDKEGKMIAFRAPDDVSDLIGNAEFVTGRTRTELLLTLVREFLPQVALRLSADHERELRNRRADFVREMGATSPAPANAVSPSDFHTPSTKGNAHKKRVKHPPSN